MAWEAVSSAPWLSLSATGGVLTASAPNATVTVSLSTNAYQFLIGSFTGTVTFKNRNDGTSQTRSFQLEVGNGGFENGDFSLWTFSGQRSLNYVDSLDSSAFAGLTALPEVDDSQFVHSGIYGAFLGQDTSLGTLRQTLPTTPGRTWSPSGCPIHSRAHPTSSKSNGKTRSCSTRRTWAR